MKHVLTLGAFLFLSSCSYKCNKTFLPYVYLDKVEITDGFFKGQTGRIISQYWIFIDLKECNSPGFTVKLLSTEEEVHIDQDSLKKIQ